MNELALDLREEIMKECRRAAELADTLINDGSRRGIVRELARNIKRRIAEIEENSSVVKYNLYFNGRVGVGKSTAICHLAGLIDKSCCENSKEFREMPLLKTASGRTTVCEMRIMPTEEQSKIVLTKLPEDEFEPYVKEFCDAVFDDGYEMPSEIIRVISNMSGYPCEGGRPKAKESDVIAYLKQSGAESLDCTKENLTAVLSGNINYGQRALTEIVFEEGRFEDWLREHMVKINDGKIPEIPFPKQISICVNSRDLELNLPEYISSIVDTRGIDTGGSYAREDIAGSMERMDAISIMCDEIPSFGTEEKIHVLLKHALNSGGRDRFHRIFLLGLEKGNEIRNSNGAEGNYERGLGIKRNEALQKLEESRIPLKKGHINCFNALSGIRYDSQDVIAEVDEAACRQTREKFWDWLKTELQETYKDFYSETKELARSLKCLGHNQFPEGIIPRFAGCTRLMEDIPMKTGSNITSLQKEIAYKMRSCHAGVIRGCVNRNGSYDSLDLYFESSLAGGRVFADTCEAGKEILIAKLKDIFDLEDEMEEICFSALKREIEARYSECYNACCKYYQECVLECMRYSSIWSKLRRLWGRGTGRYREEVIAGVMGELERQDIAAKLAEKDFYTAYTEGIEKIMNIYR